MSGGESSVGVARERLIAAAAAATGYAADGAAAVGVRIALRDAGIRAVVLVEGRSDAAAVDALAARRGLDLEAGGVCVVPMGGAMSVGRFMRLLGRADHAQTVLGLCDAQEEPVFARELAASDLFVCDRDLEDELIRSLGVDAVEAVLAEQRDLERFRTFQNQPAQRGRPTTAQVHRFLGSVGGRKKRYGRAFAAALPLGDVPEPLAALLARAEGFSVSR